MAYSLGVDLGTTFTAAAIHRDGRAEVVSLGSSGSSIPSMVYLDLDGTVLIGEAARRRGLDEPARVAKEFKRRIGDPAPILIGGIPLAADVLTGRLLAAVVAAVAEQEGGPAASVTVTHPANWGPYKTELLEGATRVAGLDGARLLSEPEAAATYYAHTDRVPVGCVVAVYDLGGGTFDASVLRRTDDGYETLGRPEGIDRLGGIDIDAAVVNYVDEAVGGALRALDPADAGSASALTRTQRECVEAKEGLSDDVAVRVGVVLPDRLDEVRLTRAELEVRIRPMLEETVACLRRAIDGAGITPAQVDRILLVGGSSRIPLVAELVGSELGRPVAVDSHPKHAVALGAAWHAAASLAPPAVRPAWDATPSPSTPSTPDAADDAAASPAPAPAPATTAEPAAPPRAPTPPAPVAPPADAPDLATPSAPPAAGGRGRLVGALVGAVVLVALVVGAVLLLGGGDDDGGADEVIAAGDEPTAFDAERDDTGECRVTWDFAVEFQAGDELLFFWQDELVARGVATRSGSFETAVGVDTLVLVRAGEVITQWVPLAGAC